MASTAGIGVSVICRQLNPAPGYACSNARRVSSSNGSRPTLMLGGVRNAYSTRGRDWLPRSGCTSVNSSYPRLSRENLKKATYFLRFFVAVFFAFGFLDAGFLEGAFAGAGFAAGFDGGFGAGLGRGGGGGA